MRKHNLRFYVTFYEDSTTAHIFAVQEVDGGGSDLLNEWLLPSWKAPSAIADWLSEQVSERTAGPSPSTSRSSR